MISRLTAILCLAALLLQLAACDLFTAALPESPDPAEAAAEDGYTAARTW